MNSCNKRTIFIGISLIFVMAAITIYVISRQFGLKEVFEVIGSCDKKWFIPAFAAALLFSVFEGINIGNGLLVSGYNPSFAQKIRYAFCGFFFSSITPSASGGQPAQVYYMHKDGINLSHSAFALLLELIGFECASIIIGTAGIFVSIFSKINLFETSGIIWFIIAGFLVNALLLTGLLLIMFSRKAVKCIARLCIRIASIFDKSGNSKKKILTSFSEYRIAALKLKKNPKAVIKVVLTSLIQLGAYHCITFFCYKALMQKGLNCLEVMSLQGLLFTSVSCIPLPGSCGAMEGGFSLLFKSIFESTLLGSAIILSRLFSFVLPLLVSGTFLLIDAVISFRQKKNFVIINR